MYEIDKKNNKDVVDIPSIHQTQIVLMDLIKWFPLELNHSGSFRRSEVHLISDRTI